MPDEDKGRKNALVLHDRFGMFIHWGLYSIPARGEWVRGNERMSRQQYMRYFEEFDASRYDPKAWAKAAKQAGQKYAVLTTKHHDGFCLFDSKLTDFKATYTPAGRDLVREYVDAFRAEGIKVGLYSIRLSTGIMTITRVMATERIRTGTTKRRKTSRSISAGIWTICTAR
ncbi:hypothetical protein PACILC2_46970 [Paenibacillus cisolokensis]|uniref:alpha-L-fucosidase n=1 Tax=Paenibacillus cisolokensis TaxID=1658519 RepID=A0ABQ4ND44_9BACL|nr:hypothetical protein PACILC2_46970 [Paenibacillus cisolokensis]